MGRACRQEIELRNSTYLVAQRDPRSSKESGGGTWACCKRTLKDCASSTVNNKINRIVADTAFGAVEKLRGSEHSSSIHIN
jgi:hypothetical protein